MIHTEGHIFAVNVVDCLNIVPLVLSSELDCRRSSKNKIIKLKFTYQ